MRVLLWMAFQAGLTGFFLYRETLGARELARPSEPLPVFILSTLGALALAALVSGLAEGIRGRRRASARRTDGVAPRARSKRGAVQAKASNDNPERARPAG